MTDRVIVHRILNERLHDGRRVAILILILIEVSGKLPVRFRHTGVSEERDRAFEYLQRDAASHLP